MQGGFIALNFSVTHGSHVQYAADEAGNVNASVQVQESVDDYCAMNCCC